MASPFVHTFNDRMEKAVRWPLRPLYKALAYTFGGTNGTGGNFGSAWLNGAFDFTDDAKRFTIKAEQLIDNSAVMATVHWGMRNFPSAPLVVKREVDGDKEEIDCKHELVKLLKRPNPYTSSPLMWQATYASLNLDGNAYWFKVRNGGGKGRVVQLWYEPHLTCRPVWKPNSTEYISGYEYYRVDENGVGRWLPIPYEDVVHFRFGQDPRNPRKGMSQFQSALREVFTDEQAQLYTAVVLKNIGVPPMIVSPEAGGIIADPAGLKSAIMQKITGSSRGEPLVVGDPVKIERMVLSPSEMDLANIRKSPVERITGLSGINRMVAGLGPDPTYANMAQAREAAFEENLLPTYQVIAADLDIQLLPDMGNPDTERCEFDTSGVRVLQDDQNKLAQRWAVLFNAGIAKRSEARSAFNLVVDEAEDDIYKAASPAPAMDALQGPQDGGDGTDGDNPTNPDEKPADGATKALAELEIKAWHDSKKGQKLQKRVEKDLTIKLVDLYGAVANHLEK